MIKNHQEVREEIFRRSDLYIKKQAARRKKIIYTSIPLSVCIVITAIFAVNNMDLFHKSYVQPGSSIINKNDDTQSTTHYDFDDIYNQNDAYDDVSGDGNYPNDNDTTDLADSSSDISDYNKSGNTNAIQSSTTKPRNDDMCGKGFSSANVFMRPDNSHKVSGGNNNTKPTESKASSTKSYSTVNPTVPTQHATEAASTYNYFDSYIASYEYFCTIRSVTIISGDREITRCISNWQLENDINNKLIRSLCQCLSHLTCFEEAVDQNKINSSEKAYITIKDINDKAQVLCYYNDYGIKEISDASSKFGTLTKETVEKLNNTIDSFFQI